MPRFKVTIRKAYTSWLYRDVTVNATDQEDAEDLALNADHFGNSEQIEDDSDWYEGRDQDVDYPEVWEVEKFDDEDEEGDDDE